MMQNKERPIKYPENREIGNQLKKGDRPEVARLSGKSIPYVREVLWGYKHNDEIIAWAKRVIADRKQRIEQIVNPGGKSTNLNES